MSCIILFLFVNCGVFLDSNYCIIYSRIEGEGTTLPPLQLLSITVIAAEAAVMVLRIFWILAGRGKKFKIEIDSSIWREEINLLPPARMQPPAGHPPARHPRFILFHSPFSIFILPHPPSTPLHSTLHHGPWLFEGRRGRRRSVTRRSRKKKETETAALNLQYQYLFHLVT
jgi:hypothetical protein